MSQRLVTALLVLGPPAAVIAAAPLLWGRVVHLHDIVLAVVLYAITGHGVTVGFHRMFTHRSFKPTRALKIALGIAGSMAVEGSIVSWVSNHRRHHLFSDRAGDPHSPHRYGAGFAAQLRGFGRAHVGRLFRGDASPFPSLARHGVRRGQFDSTAAVIRLFERAGWASGVRWPAAERLAAL